MVLFLIWQSKFIPFHYQIWCSLWSFQSSSLAVWETALLFQVCLEFFLKSWKGVRFYQMFFEHLARGSCRFFLSILLVRHVMLIGFHMLEQTCISGINRTWSWSIVLFICYLIWLASILWGFSCPHIYHFFPYLCWEAHFSIHCFKTYLHQHHILI